MEKMSMCERERHLKIYGEVRKNKEQTETDSRVYVDRQRNRLWAEMSIHSLEYSVKSM